MIRALVIGLVYITRGGQNRQDLGELAGRGRHVRPLPKPAVRRQLLLVLGLAIVHNGWAMYLIGCRCSCSPTSASCSAEEQYLRSRFGEPTSNTVAACRDGFRPFAVCPPRCLRRGSTGEGAAQGVRDAVCVGERTAAAARVGASGAVCHAHRAASSSGAIVATWICSAIVVPDRQDAQADGQARHHLREQPAGASDGTRTQTRSVDVPGDERQDVPLAQRDDRLVACRDIPPLIELRVVRGEDLAAPVTERRALLGKRAPHVHLAVSSGSTWSVRLMSPLPSGVWNCERRVVPLPALFSSS